MKKTALKRITVRDTVARISCSDFEGRLENVRDRLTELLDQHGADARLDYGQHDAWDDSYSYIIEVERPENDEEYAERVRRHEEQEQREMAELERLLKKYGGEK